MRQSTIMDQIGRLMGLRYKSHPWHGVDIGKNAPKQVTSFIEMVPSDTVKYEVDKKTVHLQYSTVNSNLELMANEILGQMEEVGLVKGESDDELENIMQGLGLNDDTDPTVKPETLH